MEDGCVSLSEYAMKRMGRSSAGAVLNELEYDWPSASVTLYEYLASGSSPSILYLCCQGTTELRYCLACE